MGKKVKWHSLKMMDAQLRQINFFYYPLHVRGTATLAGSGAITCFVEAVSDGCNDVNRQLIRREINGAFPNHFVRNQPCGGLFPSLFDVKLIT